jgi:hypothetical protein
MQKFQPLRVELKSERGNPGDIAAGPIEARDETAADRVR